MAVEPLTYSVREAAQVLGIGKDLAYQLVKSGELPSVKLGNRLVVPKAALHRLLGWTEEDENGS